MGKDKGEGGDQKIKAREDTKMKHTIPRYGSVTNAVADRLTEADETLLNYKKPKNKNTLSHF